jgi:hypothetical protein
MKQFFGGDDANRLYIAKAGEVEGIQLKLACACTH